MKVCVVTGGASGIGFDIVNKFLENDFKVVVLDIKACSIPNAHFIKTDLADATAIDSAFKAIEATYSKVHVLINNGAIAHFEKPISDVSVEEYDRLMDTNLRGAFLCAKEFVRLNTGEDYGRIINISSTRFHQNMEDWELYGMSKGGIVSLTNSLCVSLRGKAITVNCISPGYIETGDYEAIEQREHDIHPSNRVGKPRDISNVCLFLAHTDNDFINGANIIVDGGMTKRMIY